MTAGHITYSRSDAVVQKSRFAAAVRMERSDVSDAHSWQIRGAIKQLWWRRLAILVRRGAVKGFPVTKFADDLTLVALPSVSSSSPAGGMVWITSLSNNDGSQRWDAVRSEECHATRPCSLARDGC